MREYIVAVSSALLLVSPALSAPQAAAPAPPAATDLSPLTSNRPLIRGPLSIVEAVQIGLRESLSIRAARADVRGAEAETQAARSMTLPQISANTYLTTGNASNIFGTSPSVTPVNSLIVPAESFADQNFTLMVPLYTGGRLGNLVRSASERRAAAAAGVAGVQAETVLAIKDAYYRTLLDAEFIGVAQRRIDADMELVQNAQAQYEAGKGIEAVRQRAEAELADAQRELTMANNEQQKAMLGLKTVMGISPESGISLSDVLTFVVPTGDLAASLRQAVTGRPELLAVRARARAVQAQVGTARGSREPQIYGTAMADALTSRTQSSSNGATVGVVISFPLFDAGQRNAEAAQAQAAQNRAEDEVQSQEAQVSLEVRQAWLDVQTATQNYTTAQVGLKSAQTAYEVTALRVQNQKGIPVEQLDALTALTRARANLAQALYDQALAVARIERSTGKTDSSSAPLQR